MLIPQIYQHTQNLFSHFPRNPENIDQVLRTSLRFPGGSGVFSSPLTETYRRLETPLLPGNIILTNIRVLFCVLVRPSEDAFGGLSKLVVFIYYKRIILLNFALDENEG